MTWDLRERVLIVKWEAEGHEVRLLRDGQGRMGVCLRCSSIIAVGGRAQALADGTYWTGGAERLDPCKPRT